MTNKPLSECLPWLHLLLSSRISGGALIIHYFGTTETCSRFDIYLRICPEKGLALETTASLPLHCGNLTPAQQLG